MAKKIDSLIPIELNGADYVHFFTKEKIPFEAVKALELVVSPCLLRPSEDYSKLIKMTGPPIPLEANAILVGKKGALAGGPLNPHRQYPATYVFLDMSYKNKR